MTMLNVILFSVGSSILTVRETNPSLVYFTALFKRLIRISLILTSSPNSFEGITELILVFNLRFFFSAKILICLITLLISTFVSNSRSTISSLPVSILEISRISLIIESRLSDDSLIFSTSSLCSSLTPCLSRISENPRIEFIGVLIS